MKGRLCEEHQCLPWWPRAHECRGGRLRKQRSCDNGTLMDGGSRTKRQDCKQLCQIKSRIRLEEQTVCPHESSLIRVRADPFLESQVLFINHSSSFLSLSARHSSSLGFHLTQWPLTTEGFPVILRVLAPAEVRLNKSQLVNNSDFSWRDKWCERSNHSKELFWWSESVHA